MAGPRLMCLFKKNRTQGFSLVEVIVAMFIFVVILTGVMGYFSNIVRTNQNSKRIQQNLEDIRFAMSRISKVLRTSVIVHPSGGGTTSTLRVFDYSQKKCVEYTFTPNDIREAISMDSVPGGPEGLETLWCGETGGAPPMTLSTAVPIVSTSGEVSLSGNFTAYPSNDSPGSERAGRVIMNMTVSRQNNSSIIQTTVSLRNFSEISP